MGRQRICILLLAAVILTLAMLPVSAAEDTVFFTAVNNTLLDLTAETMPVKYASMIYVPSSVFNSNALGTNAFYSRSTQTVLISDGDRVLYFDMSLGNSYDSEEEEYRYAAIYVNDTAYVPAYFVASFFDLEYSYIRQEGKHIVRLSRGNVLSDDDFFSAAASLMETRLKEYNKEQKRKNNASASAAPTAAPTPEATPADTEPPSVGPEPSPTPSPPDRSSVTVHIGVLGLGENSERQLEMLQETGLPVCFFATAAEIYANADLVRRITGEGGSIGVRFESDPAAEAEAFRTALRDTAMCVSFLAADTGLDARQAQAAADTGLSVWTFRSAVSTFDGASRWLESAEWRCDLLLKADYEGFRALNGLLERDHYNVETITETTKAR